MSADTLFAITSKAITAHPQLQELKPRVRRRLARQTALTVAGWWPADYSPDYVAANKDQVLQTGIATLQPVLVAGFPALLPLLASTVLNMLARWLIEAVIRWVLSQREQAISQIQLYKNLPTDAALDTVGEQTSGSAD